MAKRTHVSERPMLSSAVNVASAFILMGNARQGKVKMDAEIKAISGGDSKVAERISGSEVYKKAIRENANVRRSAENDVIRPIINALWKCNDDELRMILKVVKPHFISSEVQDSKEIELVKTVFG